jgi:hypothetical protein
MAVALVPGFAAAGSGYNCWYRASISGNVSTQTAFGLGGKYLYSYNIVTSSDDAVTLTIYHPDGTQLDQITTTSATSGEAGKFSGGPFLSHRGFYYTLTNVASGTTALEMCGANQ